MDIAASRPNRARSQLTARIAVGIVVLVVIGFAILAIARGNLFSSDETANLAEAYAGRVDVGVYPLPGLAPAEAATRAADPYFVANALLVASGTASSEESSDADDQLRIDLRAQLVEAWDADANTWVSSGLPEEIATAAAVQALTNSGTWPDEIDADQLLARANDGLAQYLEASDNTSPFLAADLLPWVATADALAAVAPSSAAQMMGSIPVEEACASALLGESIEGLAVSPAVLTAIEIALILDDQPCIDRLRTEIAVDVAALESGLAGPDLVFHLRAIHDFRVLEALPQTAATALQEVGAASLASQSDAELAGKIEDLAGLVQAGFVPIPVSEGFKQSVLRPYSQGQLTTVSERNAGLYLLLDGILGTFDPAGQTEVRNWVDPLAADLTLQEQLVVAALGLGEPPDAIPDANEIDGTSEVALFLASARYGDEVCPLFEQWPEQPTGIFAVAVRWRAIECGSTAAPLGPELPTFVEDLLATQPWAPEDSVVTAIQLTRAVAVDCLGPGKIESSETVTDAIELAGSIIAEANPAGTNEFADWSRAVAVAYVDGGCAEVQTSLLGDGS